MYSSIVVGIDGSPTAEIALDRAIELAGNPAERAYLARRRDQLVW